MEKNYCTVHRDLVFQVLIIFKDAHVKDIRDVVSFEVTTHPYPFYCFTLHSDDFYKVPLSDIFGISITPMYDGTIHLDLSDPLYKYMKSDDQSSNIFESEEESF